MDYAATVLTTDIKQSKQLALNLTSLRCSANKNRPPHYIDSLGIGWVSLTHRAYDHVKYCFCTLNCIIDRVKFEIVNAIVSKGGIG